MRRHVRIPRTRGHSDKRRENAPGVAHGKAKRRAFTAEFKSEAVRRSVSRRLETARSARSRPIWTCLSPRWELGQAGRKAALQAQSELAFVAAQEVPSRSKRFPES